MGAPDFWRVHTSPEGIHGALQKRRVPVTGAGVSVFECTIAVEDVVATAAAIETHGGQLTMEPFEIEHVGTLLMFRVTEANWQDAIEKDPYFAESETPCFVGRAVVALAADPDVGARSGGLFSSWGLAKEYGFTGVDCRRPDWGSFFPRKVREIIERDTAPSAEDMDLFVVRTRLYQVEGDPAAADFGTG